MLFQRPRGTRTTPLGSSPRASSSSDQSSKSQHFDKGGVCNLVGPRPIKATAMLPLAQTIFSVQVPIF